VNSLVLYSIYLKKKSVATAANNRKLHIKSITLINCVGTLIFVIFTAPTNLFNNFYFDVFKNSKDGLAWLSFFNFLRFLRYGLNFMILFILDRKFRKELVKIVKKKSNKIKPIVAINHLIFYTVPSYDCSTI
jgi:hypothetical protein